ncbi:hypothetical protein CO660_11025 [Rhizobium sp. L9]|nr:hypothetical protein CO660_11025 [Rhizobium sp. L9]
MIAKDKDFGGNASSADDNAETFTAAIRKVAGGGRSSISIACGRHQHQPQLLTDLSRSSA